MDLLLKVLFFSVILFYVEGSIVVNSCSDGPSYWCKNFHTARQCGKISQCKSDYWTRPVKNGEVCDLCKDTVSHFTSYFNKNNTEELIENALKKLCRDVPIKKLSTECTQTISQDFDMLYDDIIVLIENGDLICGLLGLCSSSVTDKITIEMKQNSLQVGDDCGNCKTFLQGVHNFLSNDENFSAQWRNWIKNECDERKPFGAKKACQKNMNEAINILMHKLADNELNQICNSLKLCSARFSITGTNMDLNYVCNGCKKFVSNMWNILLENENLVNATMDEIFRSYCRHELLHLRKKCSVHVAMVMRISLTRIMQKSPQQVCTTMSYCKAEQFIQADSVPAVLNPRSNGDYCKDCTTFLTDLQGVARNNKTIVVHLEDLVLEQCNQLGSIISDLCKRQVPVVIANLLPQFEASNVGQLCTTVLMCPSAPPGPATGGDLCLNCVSFVKDWQAILAANKTYVEGLIDLTAAGYCNQLPFFVKDKCDQVAASLVQKYIQLIQTKDAHVTCASLYLCGASTKRSSGKVAGSLPSFSQLSQPVITMTKQDKSTATCELCQVIATELDSLLEKNSTEGEIIATVEKVCTILPVKDQKECDSLIKEYGDEIIKLLVNLVTPGELCTLLKLCPGKSIQVKSPATCELCQVIATELDSLLEKNSTEEEIIAAVEKVCTILPVKDRKECDSLIKEYGDEIIKALVNLIAPGELCTLLRLCPGKSVQVKSPATCELCQVIATELDNLLERNSTEEEIIAAVEKVCTILPVKDQKECDSLIKEYGDKIIKALVNFVAPGELCTLLRLCPGKSIQVKSPATCELCQVIATELDSLLERNSTEEEIIAAVEKVCTILPVKDQKECDSLIKEYGDKIIKELVNLVAPGELCTLLRLCPGKSVQVKSPATCELCQVIATELDSLLEKNSTEEEIIAAVEKVCTILPVKDQKECDSLIKEYGDKIIKALVNLVAPGELCTLLRLCPGKSVGVKSPATCELCRIIATELDSLLGENRTEEAIVAAVEKVCTILPVKDQKKCDSLIEEYGDKIIKARVNLVAPGELCTLLRLCPGKSVGVKSPATCELCQVIATELDSLLEKNSTEKEIIAAVEKVCTILPVKDRKECDSLIKEYGDEIIKALVNLVAPGELCTLLRLCPGKYVGVKSPATCELCQVIATELDSLLEKNSTEDEIIAAVEKVCTILPVKDRKECDSLIKEYGDEIIKALVNLVAPGELCTLLRLCPGKSVGVKSPATCELCQVIATELDSLLEKNSTEKEIIAAVEKVCTILPVKDRKECDSLIKEYGDEIIKALVNLVAPGELCTLLRLCPGKSVGVKSPATCELCQVIATELDSLLEKNSTEDEIIAAVEKVCTILPVKDRKECDSLIKQYGDKIIKALVNLVAPGELCTLLRLCPGKSVGSSTECEVCKLVMDQLDTMIESNATERDIILALDKVCSLFPSSFAVKCDEFVDKYTDRIIQLLTHDISPSEVCSLLRLCTNQKVTSNVKSTVCDVCKTVIQYLDQLLEANATRKDIEVALERVCANLPQELQKTCDDIVRQYTPEILDLVDHIFDPSYICFHLRLCGISKLRFIVGANPCTYGPSYWCKDMESAQRCNAVNHCRMHVWN